MKLKNTSRSAAMLLALGVSTVADNAQAQLQGLFGNAPRKPSVLLAPQITITRQNGTSEVLPPVAPTTAGACLWDGVNTLKNAIQISGYSAVASAVKSVRTQCREQSSGTSVVSAECHPQQEAPGQVACTDPTFTSLQWRHAVWRDIYSKKPEPSTGLGSLFQPR